MIKEAIVTIPEKIAIAANYTVNVLGLSRSKYIVRLLKDILSEDREEKIGSIALV